jgi:hypothetical protein
VILSLIGISTAQQDRPARYTCDFQQVEPGQLPPDVKLLRGEFVVKQEGENRLLELGIGELNSFGVLIGPDQAPFSSVQLRSWGDVTGKRCPEIGSGLGGTRGYQLWLMPAAGELQVRRDSRILARAPFDWKPQAWVHTRLEIRPQSQGRWIVSGKAWLDGEAVPSDAIVRHELTEPPPAGRASIWGTPYSEKPIHFDDVILE